MSVLLQQNLPVSAFPYFKPSEKASMIIEAHDLLPIHPRAFISGFTSSELCDELPAMSLYRSPVIVVGLPAGQSAHA